MEQLFENFGSLVFGETQMKERLPKPVYVSWKKTVSNEGTLDRQTADAIAHAMKRWALENGATHYTHWFQPLTGSTAEKHDSFIEPDENGQPMTHFSGKNLIKGEPDASSFPSGGLRATFEARGYTYWDVTSPVFIKDSVLCIPTVFVSYTGESLDKKDPLLKSLKALSEASTRVVHALGDKNVRSCNASVGLEQEYFLIDEKDYEKRLDLKMCGRTLFGADASKGQELSDHYFGAIPARVAAFMKEVDEELWKLGIYAKTEHNEVAPGQFELAQVYTKCNTAVDNNQLIMDVLKRTASRHGLACLLHEKPFAGVNGSGKHNNWSITTDDGQNLFSPGDKPAENIRFLLFVCAFMKSVDEYAPLLRMSMSSAGNDHRLGGHEAPPSILSIYLGQAIEQILYELYMEHPAQEENRARTPEFNPISGLSYIPHDNSDRNRTSPIAFTGNKFEFRMLGSSMSASMLNVSINAAMARTLGEIADELEQLKYVQDIRARALDLCREIVHDHKRILFSGDGYSKEWVKEAARRGLPNISCFAESIREFEQPGTKELFTSLHIYNEKELSARRVIYSEQYIYTVAIEARTLLEMTQKQLLPGLCRELKHYGELQAVLKTGCPAYVKQHVQALSQSCDRMMTAMEKLRRDLEQVQAIQDVDAHTMSMHDVVCRDMDDLRAELDSYEKFADADFYALPTYEQMLFSL